MNFIEIQKNARSLYYPVFLLEDTFSHTRRKNVRFWVGILSLVLFVVSVALSGVRSVFGGYGLLGNEVFSSTVIFFCIWIFIGLLEAFYYSYFYIEYSENSKKKSLEEVVFIDFDVAYAFFHVSSDDVTGTFFTKTSVKNSGGEIGLEFLLRAGVSQVDFDRFISTRSVLLRGDQVNCDLTEGRVTLTNFLLALCTSDKGLADFLFTYGIQEKEIIGIGEWISERLMSTQSRNHWWSRDSLSRIPGIGQDWSYGQIYTLKKYERYLPAVTSTRYEVHSSYGVDELKEIEAVLSRSREANVILVGNDEGGKLSLVAHLRNMIGEGVVLSALRHKRVIVLDSDTLVSHNSSKELFEAEFAKVMNESIMAGNIILVIENFPSLIASASLLGSDVPTLLESYLHSPSLQIIALSDMERFHEVLEKNTALMQYFEYTLVKDVNNTNNIKVLENESAQFESILIFTYPALEAIVESAERYFPNAVMPDKAIDLLLEIVPKLKAEGRDFVFKSDINTLVQTKTGIPVGEIHVEEREKLLHLEDLLRKRIVGQEEAIVSVSNAVRRARSGVVSADRPMSSFLFLGPTGVGKTEVTKALCEVFFGGDNHIMRLDMSEYSAHDATSKLIGSFESRQAGILSSLLREHPYGVLLLDEFEKANKEVMNLFLQILDEGFFADQTGKRVNARNLIIIATSNAGSDLIWQAVKAGEDLSGSKDKILNSIINSGMFKPELLNRFDGVILFHPLTSEHVRAIAKIKLGILHERLAGKGLNLVIDDALIDFVASHGTDPTFGARPINRAISDTVEQLVAKKIIDGSISPGSKIVLNTTELEQNGIKIGL